MNNLKRLIFIPLAIAFCFLAILMWKVMLFLATVVVLGIMGFAFLVWLSLHVDSIYQWLHKDKESLIHLIAEEIEDFLTT